MIDTKIPGTNAGPTTKVLVVFRGRICVLIFVAVLVHGFTILPSASDPPTSQPVRMIAEWEPAAGALVVWPLSIPSNLVVELARGDVLYTLVQSASAEDDARSSYQSWGVDMDNVVFIYAWLNSIWTRDWGPLMVFDAGGGVGITDPWFNGYPAVPGCASGGPAPAPGELEGSRRSPAGYDDDDAINATLAGFFSWPLYEMPAFCTGGNIMTDGFGTAMSTRLMLTENGPFMNEAQFTDLARDYLGIDRYLFFDNPQEYGIQHIDCYAKLLGPEKILVKELPPWHPEYECVEDLADVLAALSNCYGRPYRIIRIYCDAYSGNSAAAYTNSLILNDKVLVPLYGISSDAAALQTYADAMPGYEILGFEYDHWYHYDALHCRVMGIFDTGMLRVTHKPLDAETSYDVQHQVNVTIQDHSGAGLVPGECYLYWRFEGEPVWQTVQLYRTIGESFVGWIPGRPAGSIINYYVSARDSSGREETLPPPAPGGYFTFKIIDYPTAVRPPGALENVALDLFPNPSSGAVFYRLTADGSGPVTLDVYDVAGRRVRALFHETAVLRGYAGAWDGLDERGVKCPSGVYLFRFKTGSEARTKKVLLLK